MNIFNVLLLAAGRGSRMGALTNNAAKPSLDIGGESLISRLASQVASLKGHELTFVNLSHQPLSIVAALKDKTPSMKITFLWERELMGAAWSLMKVFSITDVDLLVIHADLYLNNQGLQSFSQACRAGTSNSCIAVHKRDSLKARSKVGLYKDSNVVKSFNEISFLDYKSKPKNAQSQVLSNSGLYFFRREHLNNLDTKSIEGKSIQEIVIPQLISKKQLEIVEFVGERYSIETPHDLEAMKKVNPVHESIPVTPDSI